MTRSHQILCVATVLTGAGLWQLYVHQDSTPPDAASVPVVKAAAPAVEAEVPEAPVAITATLAEAMADGRVTATFVGNGRDKLTVKLEDQSDEFLALSIPAGEVFSNGSSSVVLLRDAQLEVGETPVDRTVATAATTSSGGVGESDYSVSNQTYPRLRPLLAHLRDHPEVSLATAQTAVLALTENLPVCAFAKFATLGGDMEQVFETTPFRVDVPDIIGALSVLRAIGVPEEELALAIDPQLKIEAMIDSLAHAAAMRYYGIPSAEEWAYWKNELTAGDIRTRHYALFGIARYFPDVALQMLPDWVRQSRTNMVFRKSALTALAETQRPAAVSVLTQLTMELEANSELGQMAQECLTALKARLEATPVKTMAVAFRHSSSLARN